MYLKTSFKSDKVQSSGSPATYSRNPPKRRVLTGPVSRSKLPLKPLEKSRLEFAARLEREVSVDDSVEKKHFSDKSLLGMPKLLKSFHIKNIQFRQRRRQ